jgi:methionyl-tRNA formyltransferase
MATPQGDEGATLTRPLRRQDGLLDLRLTADALERQVRAYQPWPGSFLETAAGRLVVWGATPAGASGETMPGTFGPGPDLRVATAAGWLRLDEVQPAGGRRMSGDSWLRGRPAVAGSRTG